MQAKQSVKFFVFVVLSGTIGQLAAEVCIPSLPYIVKDFNTSESLVQLSVSYFLLGMALSGIFLGYLSDYIGRRSVLFVSAIIGALGTVFCVLSPNVYCLILGRLIQGVGFSGVSGIGRAILRDRLEGLDFARYAAYLTIATSLAIDLAPFVGGFLQAYVSWRVVFALIFVYTILLIFMIFRYQDTTLVLDKNNDKMRWSKLYIACIETFKDRHFIRFGSISGIMYAIFMMYLTVVPFIIQNVLHKSPIWFGVMILMLSIIYAVFSFINARLLSIFDIENLLQLGLWVVLVSGIALIILGFLQITPTLFIIAILPLFIGSAFVFSISDALSFATISKHIGVASALLISLRLIYGFLFTALISQFNSHNTFILGLIIFILTISGLILAILYRQKQESVHNLSKNN